MDSEFLNVFLEDATQCLSDWERLCLEIEQEYNLEKINSLFRIAHNLKGASLSIGLNNFGHYVHAVEELITKLKNKEVSIEMDLIACLLKVEENCTNWIEGLRHNPNYEVNTTDSLDQIKACMSGEKPAAVEPEQEQDLQPVPEKKVSDRPNKPQVEAPVPQKPVEIKGASVNVEKSESVSHNHQNKSANEEFIRVSLQKLDSLISLVGALVVDQNILIKQSQYENLNTKFQSTLTAISKTIYEIQLISMTLRMLPLGQVFQKMHRIVRDLSHKQEKDIELIAIGDDVELDKIIVEKLNDPLTHIIRNAVDHGIELPQDRAAAGKPPRATIKLSAEQKDDFVEIKIKDDGKGLNKEKLIAKAAEKGLIQPDSVLSDEEAYHLIFLPGFSTKEQVTDVSGRGVGMDVVKKAVHDMKGYIKIETEFGKGTCFTISLPLSLSIIRGLVTNVGKESFVIPSSQLQEIIDIRKYGVETVTGKGKILNLRGEILPLINLRELFKMKGQTTDDSTNGSKEVPGVIISQFGKKVSVQLDEIVDEQSVVLKKLSPELQNLPGIMAGAVLSSGEPALVISLLDICENWRKNAA